MHTLPAPEGPFFLFLMYVVQAYNGTSAAPYHEFTTIHHHMHACVRERDAHTEGGKEGERG